MKKVLFIFLVLFVFLSSCTHFFGDVEIPFSEGEESIKENSDRTDISNDESINTSKEQSIDTSVPTASEENSEDEYSETEPSEDETEEPISEEEISDTESDGQTSDESSGDNIRLGIYFEPYYQLMLQKNYMIRTTETRTVGGEALPYTVTAYHKDELTYIVIKESYGSESEYILKDGKLILLDSFLKVAYVSDTEDGQDLEKKLWTGNIELTEQGKQELFDSEYDFETYEDETGFEFTLFFSNGIIKRYRSYNEHFRDVIVVDLNIYEDISEAKFDIPSDFTVKEE